MHKVKSCGVLVMRQKPQMSFLLMCHPHRYDLPKGHMEAGENEWECALRELYEETGIPASALHLDPNFRFTDTYQTPSRKVRSEKVEKTVVIFLGWLQEDVSVIVSEHSSFVWQVWNPPHALQKKTIDPLLASLADYFAEDVSRLIANI